MTIKFGRWDYKLKQMLDQDLEKVTYLVVVKILEARDLKGDSSGGVNPYIKIECANLDPQQTKTIEKTAYAIWNQSFTFPSVKMNKYQLEQFELNISAYDQQAWRVNPFIGSYAIGLSTMFRYPNGEIYKKWLRLSKPDNPTKTTGYLQITAFIVGPGQDPPVHEQDEMQVEAGDEAQIQLLKQGIDPQSILEQQKQRQGLSIIEAPTLNWVCYQLMVNVYKGENLPRLQDGESPCSAFVSVRSQGCIISTRIVKNQLSPNWGQRLYIPVYIPTWNEKISIALWTRGDYFGAEDEFLANIPELPSPNDEMNISTLHSKSGKMDATWFNLYGIRPSEKTSQTEKMHSSAFLGRILMSLHLQQNERPQLTAQTNQAPSKLSEKSYQLWIDVYDLVNCDELVHLHDEKNRTFITVQGYINGKITEEYKKASKNSLLGGAFTFNRSNFDKVDLTLPGDVTQIPDLFINVNITTFPEENKQKKNDQGQIVNKRVGFIRLNYREFLYQQESLKPKWLVVQSMTSRKKNVGRLLVNARVVPAGQGVKINRAMAPRGRDIQYYFFAQIFSGYELAPGIPEETLRTRVEVKIGIQSLKKKTAGGKKLNESEKDIKTRVIPGRFPRWNWSKKPKTVTLAEYAEFASDMRVQLYSIEESLYKGKNQVMVGQFLVPIVTMLDNLYKRPQYYNVIDAEGQLQGKILARFYLIKRDQGAQDQDAKINAIYKYMKEMIEKRPHIVNFKMSLLGIRNLARATNNAEIDISLTNYENIHGITVQEAYRKAKTKGMRGDQDDEDSDDEEKRAGQDGGKWAMEGVEYRRDGSIKVVQLKSELQKETRNPNFGKVLCFSQILLQENLLLWPHMIIKLYENGIAGGVLSSQLVLPLFIFASSFIDERDIKLALAMLSDNRQEENQIQVDPYMTFHHGIARQNYSLDKDPRPIFNLKMSYMEEQVISMTGKMTPARIRQKYGFYEDLKVDFEQDVINRQQVVRKPPPQASKKQRVSEGGDDKAAAQMSEESEPISESEFVELKEIWFRHMNGEAINPSKKTAQTRQVKEGANDAEENQLLLEVAPSQTKSPFEEDPVNTDFMVEIKVDDKDKEREVKMREERKAIMNALYEKVRTIHESLNNKSDPDFKDMIRFQMMNARNKLEELGKGIMSLEEWDRQYKNDDDADGKFDYGQRQINRGPLELENAYDLPFLNMNLMQQESSSLLYTVSNSSIQNGIFASGKKIDAFMRFAITVEKVNKDHSGNRVETGVTEEDIASDKSYEDEIDDEEGDTLHQRMTVNGAMIEEEDDEVVSLQDIEDRLRRVEELSVIMNSSGLEQATEQLVEIILENFPFDIFRQSSVDKLVAPVDYYLRVYVLTCQNLSAMNNSVQTFKNQVAGDVALSSANPFLNMRIQGEEERVFYDGSDKVQKETLNPEFYEPQEIYPVRLQDDWQLEVEVMDSGSLLFPHRLIGKTMIDIEERRWSLGYVRAKLALEQHVAIAQEQIQDIAKAKQNNKKKKDDSLSVKDRNLQGLKYKLSTVADMFKKRELPLNKVEYRPLSRPDQSQSQGVVEMWVDILDAQEARQTLFEKLGRTKSDENYEVRLIIWETREVPIPNGVSMDAYIRASYQPDGLSVEPIIKETDVHRGNKNGRALFNWRMLFRIGQDEFPRLKLQIFDSGLGGSEAIGELTLNLTTSLKLLQKVGVLEDNKIWVEFANPQKANAPSGYCLIQLQILYEQDAENDPVGEARNEPNQNPVLREPPEGRGFGDMLAGMGITLPNIELPQFTMIRNIVIGVVVVMGLFFVMFLILAVK